MQKTAPFTIKKENIFAIPVLHYTMEFAKEVHRAFHVFKPDCIAVELPETMQLQFLHAASRLPDISVVVSYESNNSPIFYLSEPCDPIFEGLRCACEHQLPAFCIDLDVDDYPEMIDPFPDPYAIEKIGLEQYYTLSEKILLEKKAPQDDPRELYMAKRLKELSFSHDKVMYICGMAHLRPVLELMDRNAFPHYEYTERSFAQVCTLTENSCRDVMAECGWISKHYELFREGEMSIDRQKLILSLFREAGAAYVENTNLQFPGYHYRNLMKFLRNYSLLYGRLMPSLYQIVTAAKGCVDHNYAYETWELATEYPYLKNIDSLQELDLSPEEIWGNSQKIRFSLKAPQKKGLTYRKKRKDQSKFRFAPPGMFSICSYPPEDVIVEKFGEFLQKKGTQILSEDGAETIPFSTSLEDGIDTKETIRHWAEKKLYVKKQGKPPGGVGSVVVIFDEAIPDHEGKKKEKYFWKTTWLGEHEQESDMAFYATPMGEKIVGPGISRCEYGGFLMSYPPRRMEDVWHDPDYSNAKTKSEVLLMAAIDYSIKPLIVYVASHPPRSAMKSYARRYGKKVVYIPMGQLSKVTFSKIRIFHVLDSHLRRNIADDYIY